MSMFLYSGKEYYAVINVESTENLIKRRGYQMTTVLRPSTYTKSPKSCQICGVTFNGTKSAKYCSNKCKMKNRNSKGKL